MEEDAQVYKGVSTIICSINQLCHEGVGVEGLGCELGMRVLHQ